MSVCHDCDNLTVCAKVLFVIKLGEIRSIKNHSHILKSVVVLLSDDTSSWAGYSYQYILLRKVHTKNIFPSYMYIYVCIDMYTDLFYVNFMLNSLFLLFQGIF